MWEFSVMADVKNENAVSYIQDKMKNTLLEFDGVYSYVKENGSCSFSLGAAKEKSEEIKKKLTKVLCDAICEKMKYNYLKENVCVNIQDSKMFETFLKVYTYFDIELEKAIAIRAICFPKCLNLEGFLNFRLHKLKQKWQELCLLTNTNASVFLKSETFLDVLEFLISNLDYKHKKIVIDFQDGTICDGIDSSEKLLTKFVTDDIFDLLTKLVDLLPREIVVLNLFDEEKIHLLQNIFQNRVEFTKK